jgi:hypothetical protein
MKLSLHRKREHPEPSGGDTGERDTPKTYSTETHFEQFTMPSGKDWLPKSWRDLLGLEPRER